MPKALSAFIFFAFACAFTQAVELARDEPAEVLLFPFFTTEKGWDTYINLASPDGRSKVFKVRVLDGLSGEPVKAFNVYLTRRENWRASISRQEEGGSRLQVEEGGCLVKDDLSSGGIGSVIEFPNRVGMIEVFSLGGSFSASSSTTCADLADRWKPGGEWDSEPIINDSPENRLLLGELYLVNVADGLAATYLPAGLKGFRNEVEHSHPASSSPNLAEAEPVARVDGIMVEPESGEGIDAVALALARDKPDILNDVITSPEINARTDWVISYPLARHKHYKPAQVVINGEDKWCEPFGANFPEPGDPVAPLAIDSRNDVAVWGQGVNVELGQFTPIPVNDVQATLCQAVNVVPFGGQEPLLVDVDSAHLSPEPGLIREYLNAGVTSYILRWAPYPSDYPEDSDIYRPALGFRLTVFENGFLDGGSTLANYAVIRNHQRRD